MKIIGKCKRCGKKGYVSSMTKLCKKCGPKVNKEEKK